MTDASTPCSPTAYAASSPPEWRPYGIWETAGGARSTGATGNAHRGGTAPQRTDNSGLGGTTDQTGGHCSAVSGEVDGRPAIVEAIRERAQRGVAIVKIMASGGGSSGSDLRATDPQEQYDDRRLRYPGRHQRRRRHRQRRVQAFPRERVFQGRPGVADRNGHQRVNEPCRGAGRGSSRDHRSVPDMPVPTGCR